VIVGSKNDTSAYAHFIYLFLMYLRTTSMAQVIVPNDMISE